MTRHLSCAALGLVAAIATVAGQAPQQTFRSGTDVVLVDVAVRDGGRNVTGLSAADFVLKDNGVPQRVETAEPGAVPLDVSLLVDLSGNPRRPYLDRRFDAVEAATQVAREVNAVAALLRPFDRVRLITLDRYVRQVFSFRSKNEIPTLHDLEAGGMPLLFDGVAAALLHPVAPARRHVVIVRTKGADSLSILQPTAIQTIASRSDALFHFVMSETALDNDAVLKDFQCTGRMPTIGPSLGPAIEQPMGLCWPVTQFLAPAPRLLVSPGLHQILPFGLPIKSGAEGTGGGWHQALGLAVPSLTSVFKDTFENFRSNYILRYVPTGVTREGWHRLEVTVPKFAKYQVASRTGYGVDDVPAQPTTSRVAAEPARPFDRLAAAYARRSYTEFVEGVRAWPNPEQLLREVEAGGLRWLGSPRLEAAFALEMAEPALFSETPSTRAHARVVLDRVTRWIRQPLEPDGFERDWYFAALTLAQGTIRVDALQPLLDLALERFPSDPQFLLIQAIATEQRSLARAPVPNAAAPAASPDDPTRLAEQQYRRLTQLPSTSGEAQIRLAGLYNRVNRPDAALEVLALPVPADLEPALRYLRELVRGQVLINLDRPADAVTALRNATVAMPGAQSARVALMNALGLIGQRGDAAVVAESILAGPQVVDPWVMYWQGLYRLHPRAIGRLREGTR